MPSTGIAEPVAAARASATRSRSSAPSSTRLPPMPDCRASTSPSWPPAAATTSGPRSGGADDDGARRATGPAGAPAAGALFRAAASSRSAARRRAASSLRRSRAAAAARSIPRPMTPPSVGGRTAIRESWPDARARRPAPAGSRARRHRSQGVAAVAAAASDAQPDPVGGAAAARRAGVVRPRALLRPPPRAARPRCICRRAPGRRFASTATSQTLDGAPVLGPNDVESLLLTLMPERDAEALRTGAASEWICEIADVGRVRCMSFRDHRGPGGVFRLMRPRGISAEQLGLAARDPGARDRAGRACARRRPALERQAHAHVGVRGSHQPQRRDHVITIESEINVVHERVGCVHQPARGPRRRATRCWRRRARRCAKIPTCSCSRTCGRPA